MITIESKPPRTNVLFVRLSEGNINWLKDRAKEHSLTVAEYTEQLLFALKGDTTMAKSKKVAKKPAKKGMKK